MKRTIDFLKRFPIITAIIAIVVGYFGTKLLAPSDGSTLKVMMVRVVLALAACFFLYLVSGEKTFDCCQKTTGYVLLYILPLFAIPLLTLVMGLFGSIYSGAALRSDWLTELIVSIVLYLFVGIFEEVTFRVVINDAMLSSFRNVKGIFVIIAVVSSLVFGAVHVIDADFSDPAVILPVVLKTVSAGLGGLCYLFLYWKTRNLWGIAIAHGLYDFLSSFSSILFVSDTDFTSGAARYASAANSGTSTIVYLVQIVFTLAVVIFLWFKVVRKIDFKELRETW